MGLKGSMKHVVFDKLAPMCRKPGRITAPNAVRISDVLNSLRGREGARQNNTFSGIEFRHEFFDRRLDSFLAGTESMFWIVVDDSRLVPKQKSAEQARRIESRKPALELVLDADPTFVPYTDDCTFQDDGIVRPQTADDDDGDDDDSESGGCRSGAGERFYLELVLNSRALRKKLMHFLGESIANAFGQTIPEGKSIMLLYDGSEGAWEIGHGCLVPILTGKFKGHSEFDTTVIRVAHEYIREHPIIIETTDTDTIPLVVSMYDHINAGVADVPPVYWVCEPDFYVDCGAMTKGILSNVGLTARQFVLFCILCGTDYTDKMVYAKGFNDGAIRAAFSRPDCLKAFDELDAVDHTNIEPLSQFQRWLYTASVHPDVKREKFAGRTRKQKETRVINAHLKFKERLAAIDDQDMEPSSSSSSSSPPPPVVPDDGEVLEEEDVVVGGGDKKRKKVSTMPPSPRKKAKQARSLSSTGLSAHAAEDVRRCMEEFDRIKDLSWDVSEPLEWDAIASQVKRDFKVPSKETLTEVMSTVCFTLWFWTQSPLLPGWITYEDWCSLSTDGRLSLCLSRRAACVEDANPMSPSVSDSSTM